MNVFIHEFMEFDIKNWLKLASIGILMKDGWVSAEEGGGGKEFLVVSHSRCIIFYTSPTQTDFKRFYYIQYGNVFSPSAGFGVPT
jgi:hypothetical protein